MIDTNSNRCKNCYWAEQCFDIEKYEECLSFDPIGDIDGNDEKEKHYDTIIKDNFNYYEFLVLNNLI